MCISIFPCPTEKNFKIFQPEDQDPGDVLQLVLLLLHALWHRPQLARTYRCRQISILLYQNEQVASVEARLTQSLLSTGTLFISFLIAAILDVPGKLLALVACVRIPSNAFVVLVAKNHSRAKKTMSFSSSWKTWMGRRFPYIGLNCFAGLFFIINCFLPRCTFRCTFGCSLEKHP